ncbi:tetratricopeptide repeat protein [Lusitaniella coriacea LEGE 07157]|uniref:Tetratricopeptide repeat protein n=1 Tax=Lusitaniella coriacea LEGE 07157 TaxID=945747 RepID=A0A8J7E6H6_9CYAN|nr:CHAT domain-containing tetratricopeptide repeat protein [Lusitaniella coriacea]MBE9119159.1 tetratricopeptide repeat protein [Lusitaniella coriacea LEGE 07157]
MSQSFSRVQSAVALLVLSLLWVSVPVLVFEDARQVQAQAQTVDTREAEADRLSWQGLQQAKRGQFQAAIQFWKQALQLYQELGNRRKEIVSLYALGSAYYFLEQYEEAIDFHQQSLSIAREIGDRTGEGDSLNSLGDAYRSLEQHEKAIEFYQQSLIFNREVSDLAGESDILDHLGNSYYLLGQYQKAIEFHQQSLNIAEEIGDRARETKSLGNLGNAYHFLGQYEKAIGFYQQSLAIAWEIGDRRGVSSSFNNLGLVYQSLGQYEKAIAFHQRSLNISKEIEDRVVESSSLNSLGLVYESLGQYEQAIDLYQQSLSISKNMGNRIGQGQSFGNLGNVYQSLGQYEKAIEFHQQSLTIKREIGDRAGEGASLGNLGIVYDSLGQYEKAIDLHKRSLILARETGNSEGEGHSLNNLGLAFYQSSQLAKAEENLFASIEVKESIRANVGDNDANKISIFETQASTYRTLQKVLIAQNKTDRALEISERGRARAFVELLSQRISPETVPEPPTIEQIKQIAQDQNATLVEYSIIVDELDIDGKKEWRESQLYIWVVKPTGEVNFRTADLTELSKKGESLNKLVTRSRNSIGVRNRSLVAVRAKPDGEEPVNRLRQLHQILIEPIADLLPADPQEKVIFMPQGALFLAPFPALQDENENYLIEKHTILTAPAIQVLQLTREQRSRGAEAQGSRGGALIVGNPTMPSVAVEISETPTKLNPLPGSEREANKIAEFLNTEPLIGAQATRQAVLQQMSNANIVHLATHGLLDDFKGQGVPGAIALAPDGTGERNDGLLTANEILDLNLNADLVVLSACDTGRGEITGDGVIGLSRSLVLAGVPSILVSLWAVDDHSTAFLMSEFYKNWQETGDKAQSLRQAMLATMEEYPQPIDWAAFTLIGESE